MTAPFMIERPRIQAPIVLAGTVRAVRAAPAASFAPQADADVEIAQVFRNTTRARAPRATTYRHYTYVDHQPFTGGINICFRLTAGQRLVVWADGFDGMLAMVDHGPKLAESLGWLQDMLRGLSGSDVRSLGANEDARRRQLALYDELIAWAAKNPPG